MPTTQKIKTSDLGGNPTQDLRPTDLQGQTEAGRGSLRTNRLGPRRGYEGNIFTGDPVFSNMALSPTSKLAFNAQSIGLIGFFKYGQNDIVLLLS